MAHANPENNMGTQSKQSMQATCKLIRSIGFLFPRIFFIPNAITSAGVQIDAIIIKNEII
jgi:hypothetical protein